MGSWLRRALERVAEPRVATGLAIAVYAVCFGLSVALLWEGLASGDVWTLIPPALLLVASGCAVPSAHRGGYWGWSLERLCLILAWGGLVAGGIVEVSSVYAGAVELYVAAFLFVMGVLAWFRGRWLQRSLRSWREVSLRIPLLVG